MRKLWICSIAALMFFGCSDSDTDVNSKLPKGKTKSEVVSKVQHEETKTAEMNTGGPAGANNIDPVFKDYEYPAADFDGAFTTGNIVSVSYFSQDDLARVSEFYNKKFPGPAIPLGSSKHFTRQDPDGNHLSATISQVADKTHIVLMIERSKQAVE